VQVSVGTFNLNNLFSRYNFQGIQNPAPLRSAPAAFRD
jgi:hypothetical protein